MRGGREVPVQCCPVSRRSGNVTAHSVGRSDKAHRCLSSRLVDRLVRCKQDAWVQVTLHSPAGISGSRRRAGCALTRLAPIKACWTGGHRLAVTRTAWSNDGCLTCNVLCGPTRWRASSGDTPQSSEITSYFVLASSSSAKLAPCRSIDRCVAARFARMSETGAAVACRRLVIAQQHSATEFVWAKDRACGGKATLEEGRGVLLEERRCKGRQGTRP
jgi:hypothetical protein